MSPDLTWSEQLAQERRARDRYRFVALVLAIATLVGGKTGYDYHMAQAEMYLAEAASHKLRADSLSAAVAPIRQRADSLARTYTADSTRWAAERTVNRDRAASGTRRATEASEVARAAEVAVDSATTVFRAALPPEHVEPFDSLMAAVDRRDAAKDTMIAAQTDVIEAQDSTIVTEREDNAALRVRVTTLTEANVALVMENEAVRIVAGAQERAIESLRKGLNASGRQNRWLKIGAITLAGLAVYDRVVGG